MTSESINTPTRWAQALGYGGLVPFVGLSLVAWLLPVAHRTVALSALVGYSATILSFVGALHWGLTLRDVHGPSTRMLAWGVVPSLVAWMAMLLPTAWGLSLLALGLWSCWGMDRIVYPRLGLQGWLPMRLQLTTVASVCCLAAAWSTP